MQLTVIKNLKSFARDQSGAVAIEYVLIAGAMGFALIASAPILSTAVKGRFVSVAGYFSLF